MWIYAVSKNSAPGILSKPDPVHLLYLGHSISEAERIVGDFQKFATEEKDFPKNWPELYSALPSNMEREIIQFFINAGQWYTIERFDLTTK